MAFTWQCPDHKRSGVDDMTLLPQITDSAIVDNLKKRFDVDWIFTYIGPVLVSVNPFKGMKYFTQREVDMYQGAAQYENPPHIYALADNMYRNMTTDQESQCVIISGESGAGKTVAAKFIMSYLSQVSGGGVGAEHIKDVILKSNPLLEAFGNAKTVRNNNSSRFGKYVEVLFVSGNPVGGKISNFLLEKSRVVTQNPYERNFHIFYQAVSGLQGSEDRDFYGATDLTFYNYLNVHKCFQVEGIDDVADFEEMLEAMETMGLDGDQRSDIFSIVFAILHLGNVLFSEAQNDEAIVEIDECLDYPSCLLQVDKELLRRKLTSRVMETKWGSKTERVDVTCNVQQAEATRDALAKGLYARLFDYLVKRINIAMQTKSNVKPRDLLTLGILDIYGFEIFQKNGFEQFCINYVNEKLQQIFIELTLKAEQEEYVQEGIEWKQIDYFNNAVVCQLIEEKLPKPGIMAILDDVCASQHGVHQGADQNLKAKLRDNCHTHQFFQDTSEGFFVHHYAGKVRYDVDGFCERNRDIFNNDLIELMQSSGSEFIRNLFPENLSEMNRKRPVTAGAKIKSQANDLVKSLMLCSPHYIRCIKPNETKRPGDWNKSQVEHQVEYLGLKENIRVRRAGFAYRRPFEKFLQRYAILTKETWPRWASPDIKKGVGHILKSVNMASDDYQFGKSKLFIKAPESLFLLEEQREKKFDYHARIIQKAFKKYFNSQKLLRQKEEAADLLVNRKERREFSINRTFYGDYIGLDDHPALRTLVGRRDKIEFAQQVYRYDRKLKGVKCYKRDLVVTQKGIFLIGREPAKTGPTKGQMQETISRHIPFDQLSQISMSQKQDDFVILHVLQSYDSLLLVPFKTEFVSIVNKFKEAKGNGSLKLVFQNRIDFVSDKSTLGAGKKRCITFKDGISSAEKIISEGLLKSNLVVFISPSKLEIGARPSRVDLPKRKTSSRKPPLAGPGAPLPPVPVTESSYRKSVAKPARKAPGAPLKAANVEAPTTQRSSSSVKWKERQQSQVQPNIVALRQHLEQQRRSKGPLTSSVENTSTNLDFLQNPPDGGQARATRISIEGNKVVDKPLPAGGRPKPAWRKRNAKARVLYSYEAADTDELSILKDECVEIILEDPSGWWRGRKTNGESGLFPGSYVEKIPQ